MKLQAGQLVGTANALAKLFGQDMDAVISYWIRRFLVKIEPEARAFDEVRTKLAEEHAEKDADGKPQLQEDDEGRRTYVVRDIEALNEAVSKIAQEEVDIPFRKIKIKLTDLEGKSLSGADIGFLENVMDIQLPEEDKPDDDQPKVLELKQ